MSVCSSSATGLRRFLRWSEEQADAVGPHSGTASTAARDPGSAGSDGPTIGDIAEALLLRHHSAVELIDRAEAAGFVRRRPDRDDQRVVRLSLTPLGSRRLHQLSERHLEELERLRPQLDAMWHGIV